ncbi:hypothetical protein [Nocardia sp. IFM 10818]
MINYFAFAATFSVTVLVLLGGRRVALRAWDSRQQRIANKPQREPLTDCRSADSDIIKTSDLYGLMFTWFALGFLAALILGSLVNGVVR